MPTFDLSTLDTQQILMASGTILVLLIAAILFYGPSKKKPQAKSGKLHEAKKHHHHDIEHDHAKAQAQQPLDQNTQEQRPKAEEKKAPTQSWADRLKQGLARSRQDVWSKALNLLSKGHLDQEEWEHVEEILYNADVGPQMTQELLSHLQEKLKSQGLNEEELKAELFNYLKEQMAPVQSAADKALFTFDDKAPHSLKVIMIVGVNGVGKTTTIGKLATKLTSQGAKVVVGACDTFRAAAVDQLQVWCDRANAVMIRAKEGNAPSGVGYMALEKAIELKADYCLLDTAGRLHTKENLMQELTKSKNVLSKLMPDAPHHVLLVLDAITGQNALRQAQEFHKALALTGLIFTKCDGSSKAGSALGIVSQLKVPISYIGVGEGVEDLNTFKLDEYLNALLDVNI